MTFFGPGLAMVIFSYFSYFDLSRTCFLSYHLTYVSCLALPILFKKFQLFLPLFQNPKTDNFSKNHFSKPSKTFQNRPSNLDFSHFWNLSPALRHPIFITKIQLIKIPKNVQFQNLFSVTHFILGTIITRNYMILHEFLDVCFLTSKPHFWESTIFQTPIFMITFQKNSKTD